MAEFKFAVGDVVRHRVGGSWRGLVMMQRRDDRGEAQYLAKAELKPHAADDGSQFASWWYQEFELLPDAEPPPSPSLVPQPLPPGGDGAAAEIPPSLLDRIWPRDRRGSESVLGPTRRVAG